MKAFLALPAPPLFPGGHHFLRFPPFAIFILLGLSPPRLPFLFSLPPPLFISIFFLQYGFMSNTLNYIRWTLYIDGYFDKHSSLPRNITLPRNTRLSYPLSFKEVKEGMLEVKKMQEEGGRAKPLIASVENEEKLFAHLALECHRALSLLPKGNFFNPFSSSLFPSAPPIPLPPTFPPSPTHPFYFFSVSSDHHLFLVLDPASLPTDRVQKTLSSHALSITRHYRSILSSCVDSFASSSRPSSPSSSSPKGK